MDCDHCQRLLMEVACGEDHLPGVADARAHAVDCSVCRPALDTLERGLHLAAQLPLVEPSQKATDEIMRLARNHALASRTLAHAPASPRADLAPGLGDRIRIFLGQFAMGRQVAMATVMVLVIAVGFWFVPGMRRHELAGGNVVNPDTDGEAGPSDGIVAAAPLDLDLRQGRIRARDDATEHRRVREPGIVAEPTSEPTATEESARIGEEVAQASGADTAAANVPAAMEFAPPPPSDDALKGLVATDSAPEREKTMPTETVAAAAAMPSPRRAAPARAYAPTATAEADEFAMGAAPLPAAPSASASADLREESSGGYAPPAPSSMRSRSAPGAGAGSVATSAAESMGEASAPSARTQTDSLASGAASFRAGDYRAAIDAFESANRQLDGGLPSTARLSLARSYQRTGRCNVAIAHYETFLRTAPRASDAMLELAACYRRLGRTEQADQLASRANTIVSGGTSNKRATPKSAPAAITPAR